MSSALLTELGSDSPRLGIPSRPWEFIPNEQSLEAVRQRYLLARDLADELSARGFDIAPCWYAHTGYVALLVALYEARAEVESARQMVSWWQDADRLLSSLPMVIRALRHDVRRHPVEGSAIQTTTMVLPRFEDWQVDPPLVAEISLMEST